MGCRVALLWDSASADETWAGYLLNAYSQTAKSLSKKGLPSQGSPRSLDFCAEINHFFGLEPDVTVKVVFAVRWLVSPVASIECLPGFVPAGRVIVNLTLNFPFWSAFRLAGGLKAVLSNVKTTVSPGAQPLPFRVVDVDLPAAAWFGLMLILVVAANTGEVVNRRDNDNRIAAKGTAKRGLKNKRCI